MRVWTILIDSRPAYLCGRGSDASLLRAPLGPSTVFGHVLASLGPVGAAPPVVLADAASSEYKAWIKHVAPGSRAVDSPEALVDAFPRAELSDVFLIIDPRCLPVHDSQMASLIRIQASDPRIAHHLVALDAPIGGTKECVAFDAAGRIRSVQRHYEEATWPFLAGVAATALPGAAGVLGDGLRLRSLVALRHALTAGGIPSRDIPVVGGTRDLASEHGILAVNELMALQAASVGPPPNRSTTPICIGSGHQIHLGARFIGPVVLHPDVHIADGATVVGPAVIGAGATISSGAIVAHALVGSGAVVPCSQVVRDRAWFETADDGVPEEKLAEATSYDDRLARLSFLAAEWDAATDQAISTRVNNPVLKRVIDIFVASLGLLVLLPLVAVIAAAIWLESRGPVFYGDQREGLGGRSFGCWKFRTMIPGAHLAQRHLNDLDQTDGPHFKVERDPRVTRVGAILRALNIDEIPQLFNVLVGQMSLVGPRPSPFRENQICVPWREARLSVRPGITGFWQVCRHDRAVGDFHQWIEYDLLYVQHLTVWLDLKILAATALTLGGKCGNVPASWLVSSLRTGTASTTAPASAPASVSVVQSGADAA